MSWGRWISSQPDYFLGQEKLRRKFKKVGFLKIRHHDTNHQAVVATLYSGSKKKMRPYRRRRQRFPLRLPRVGPQSEKEDMFKELKGMCEEMPPREQPTNTWILAETWALIDHQG